MNGESLLNSGHNLTTGWVGILKVGCERKRGDQDHTKVFGLSNEKNGVAIS